MRIPWWQLLYEPFLDSAYFWKTFLRSPDREKVLRSLVLLFATCLMAVAAIVLLPTLVSTLTGKSVLLNLLGIAILMVSLALVIFVCELVFFLVYLGALRLVNGRRMVFSNATWITGLVVVCSLPETVFFPALAAKQGESFLPLFLAPITALLVLVGVHTSLRAAGQPGLRLVVSALVLFVPAAVSMVFFPFASAMGMAKAVVFSARAIQFVADALHLTS